MKEKPFISLNREKFLKIEKNASKKIMIIILPNFMNWVQYFSMKIVNKFKKKF